MTVLARCRWAVALLAIVAAAPSLDNQFAYDDVPVVLENAKVHELRPPWRPFGESYWTGNQCCSLYRPFVILAYSLEWSAGRGRAWLFHAINVALIAALSALVFELALLLLPTAAALFAAAAFAVHPAHVEAVANIIGQAELWMTAAIVVATLAYVRVRRQAEPTYRARLVLFGAGAIATFSKEQGVTLPALLLFAELFIVGPDNTSDGTNGRWPRARAMLTIGVLGALLAFAVRVTAVTGLGSGLPAAGLVGLRTGERVAVAIGTMPVWARLMLWPSSLSAEYAPPAYGPALGSGAHFIGGIAIAVVVFALLAWSWTRRPATAFGLLWFIAALSPVSNFLFATGIVVAERTLMLPSVGVVIAVADLGWHVWTSLRAPFLRQLLVATAVLLVGLGVSRSMSRSRVWYDNAALFAQMPLDSPRSYRTYKMLSMVMLQRGDTVARIAALEHALALWDRDPELLSDRGQLARVQHGCAAGIPYFSRAVLVDSSAARARSRLFACLLEVGNVDSARRVAAGDPDGDQTMYRKLLAKADSTAKAVR